MTARRHGVLLVDDEALARQRLRQLLHAATDFEIVGECVDARTVAEAVQRLRPSVVFLDIRMPYIDGFAVREAIRAVVRHVVFVTAHAEHAARAFDVAASDYLVKPVTQARFNSALDRMRGALAEVSGGRVLLGGRQGGTAVDVVDVSRVEADGAYVVVHASGRQHVLRESLAQMLARLGVGQFVRIHRSAGINVAHVRALRRGKRGGLEVELIDGTRLPISRRKGAEVVELLRRQPREDRPQRPLTVGASTD